MSGKPCNIAADERENALAAIPIYRAEPWLDLALRLDGVFSTCETMILEKVRWLDEWLGEIQPSAPRRAEGITLYNQTDMKYISPANRKDWPT